MRACDSVRHDTVIAQVCCPPPRLARAGRVSRHDRLAQGRSKPKVDRLMIAPLKQLRPKLSRTVVRNRFPELLPQIEYYANCAFRKMDRERREDAIQEVRANAWCAYHRLVELGKEDLAYASVLARFAVAQYRDGRRVGAKINSRDVCSRQAQQKRAFRVHHLDSPRRQGCNWEDGLTDNTRSAVPDQAAFRIDFPAWLSTQSRWNRRLVQSLIMGNRTKEVARCFEISASRVSQLRREFERSWHQYHGEE